MKFLEYVNKYKNYFIGGVAGLVIGVTIGTSITKCNSERHAKWEKEDMAGQLIIANMRVKEAKPWFDMSKGQRELVVASQKADKIETTYSLNPMDYTKPQETNLSPGNYKSGADFVAGTYTIVATGGMGNVISSNSSEGGINEVMNSDGSNGRIKEFKNVKLPKNTEIKLLGSLQVKLVPVK